MQDLLRRLNALPDLALGRFIERVRALPLNEATTRRLQNPTAPAETRNSDDNKTDWWTDLQRRVERLCYKNAQKQLMIEESGVIQLSNRPRSLGFINTAYISSHPLELHLRGGATDQVDETNQLFNNTDDSSSDMSDLESDDTDLDGFILEINWDDFSTLYELIHSPVGYCISLFAWIKLGYFLFKVIKKEYQIDPNAYMLPRDFIDKMIDAVL